MVKKLSARGRPPIDENKRKRSLSIRLTPKHIEFIKYFKVNMSQLTGYLLDYWIEKTRCVYIQYGKQVKRLTFDEIYKNSLVVDDFIKRKLEKVESFFHKKKIPTK